MTTVVCSRHRHSSSLSWLLGYAMLARMVASLMMVQFRKDADRSRLMGSFRCILLCMDDVVQRRVYAAELGYADTPTQ